MQAKSQLNIPHIIWKLAASLCIILLSLSIPFVVADEFDTPKQEIRGQTQDANNQEPAGAPDASEKPKELTPEEKVRQERIVNFNLQQDTITNSQSRLGDELKSLPGPNIDFQGLLRLVITWSASLAASVAIFLVVMRSFASISGTEETHNELKTTIIKVGIGLLLIFFSYMIVSFLMGIIWAGGSVGG